jgi:hypothetical protein
MRFNFNIGEKMNEEVTSGEENTPLRDNKEQAKYQTF